MSVADEELWDLLELAAKNATGDDNTDITDFVLILEDEWITDVDGLRRLKPETLDELLPLLLSQELQRLVHRREDGPDGRNNRRWRRGPPKAKRSRSRRKKSSVREALRNFRPSSPEMAVIDEETSFEMSLISEDTPPEPEPTPITSESPPEASPVGDEAPPEASLVSEDAAPEIPPATEDTASEVSPVREVTTQTSLVCEMTPPEMKTAPEMEADPGIENNPEISLVSKDTAAEMTIGSWGIQTCHHHLTAILPYLGGKATFTKRVSVGGKESSSSSGNQEERPSNSSGVSEPPSPAPHEAVTLEPIDVEKCDCTTVDEKSTSGVSSLTKNSQAVRDSVAPTAAEDEKSRSSKSTQSCKSQTASRVTAPTTVTVEKCSSSGGSSVTSRQTSRSVPAVVAPTIVKAKRCLSSGGSFASKHKSQAAPNTVASEEGKKFSISDGSVTSKQTSQSASKATAPTTTKAKKCSSSGGSVTSKQASRSAPAAVAETNIKIEKDRSTVSSSVASKQRPRSASKGAAPAKVNEYRSGAGSVAPRQTSQSSSKTVASSNTEDEKSTGSISTRKCKPAPALKAAVPATTRIERCKNGGGGVTRKQHSQSGSRSVAPITTNVEQRIGGDSVASKQTARSAPAPKLAAPTIPEVEKCRSGGCESAIVTVAATTAKDEIREDPPGVASLSEEESSSSSSLASLNKDEPLGGIVPEPPSPTRAGAAQKGKSQATPKASTSMTAEDSKCCSNNKRGSLLFKIFDLVDNLCQNYSNVEDATTCPVEVTIDCHPGEDEGIDDDELQQMLKESPFMTDPDSRAQHPIADAARKAKIVADARAKFPTREALEDAIERYQSQLEAEGAAEAATATPAAVYGKETVFERMDNTREMVSPAEYELRKLYPLRLILPTVGDLMEMINVLQPRRERAMRELDMKTANGIQKEIDDLQKQIDEEERYLMRRRMGEVECVACGEMFVPEAARARILRMAPSGGGGGSVASTRSGSTTSGKAKERHCDKCQRVFGGEGDGIRTPSTGKAPKVVLTGNKWIDSRRAKPPSEENSKWRPGSGSLASSYKTWYAV